MTDLDTSPAEEGTPAEEGAPATSRRRRSPGFVVAAALALVFFVSTVLLAVVAAGLKSDKDELIDGRAQVADTAGRFVTAILAYDYRDLDGFRERALALTAPPFSEQFDEAIDRLQAGVVAAEQVSVPTIDDVFVAEVGSGTATAIVVYDRVLDGIAGQRTESNLYVRLGLVERDGEWRVNDVINLNLAAAESAPPGDESTTTPSG